MSYAASAVVKSAEGGNIVSETRLITVAAKCTHVALLLAALALVNLAAARLLPATWDLTSQNAFTLTPQTTSLLVNLSQPVSMTVIATRTPRSAGDRAFAQTEQMLGELLDLYRRDCPLVHVCSLDPDESDAARRLQQRFPDVTVPSVVIVHGTGSVARHEVLRQGDLVDVHTAADGKSPIVEFRGEQAVTAALSRLKSGRRQTIVYCLTGHGELSLGDTSTDSRRGLGTLARQLREVDCELRPLALQAEQRIPPDADLVLVAGLDQPFSADEAARLRSYLLHGGRAILLFDLVHDRLQKQGPQSGLEDLLTDYGVVVGQDRVITRGFSGQRDIASPALPAPADHPLVRSLSGSPLTLYDCRSVRLLSSVRQVKTHAVPLLVSHAFPRAWAESILESASPVSSETGGRLRGPVGMAVAVERPGAKAADPVLVVVGDAEFAANRALAAPAGRQSYAFLAASLNWLRGSKELLADVPPRRHEPYHLTGDPADHRGLVWKSTLLLCASILTAGTTVWTVRRVG